MQKYNVVVAVTALDETGVPFGFTYFTVQIGGATYCEYKHYTDTVTIHVVKWARAGQGSIIVGVLNKWPAQGGTVISGPFPPTKVDILAQYA
jgi:hypothetical protein